MKVAINKIGKLHDISINAKNFSLNKKINKDIAVMKIKESLKIKPFVKWAGGKRQIMNLIIENLPHEFNNYFEPFVGGGSVYLELENLDLIKGKSFINDINLELIETYKCIKNNKCQKELISLLWKHKNKNTKELYLKIRSWDQNKNYLKKYSRAERSSRLIYMNRVCFNGLYRVNSKNYFNVPYGRYENPKILDVQNLYNLKKVLKHTYISNSDFEVILKKAKSGDFVYIDPPYMPPDNGKEIFNSYSKYKFCVKEQTRLRDTMDELTKRGVKVLLSNSYCKWIIEKYSHYKIIKIKVNRPINSKGLKRRVDFYNEVLIKNY